MLPTVDYLRVAITPHHTVDILPPTTAALHPGRYRELALFTSKYTVVAIMAALITAGFILRISGLGVESFGEDELNKLETVEEYRQNGLTGKNGEHPFLMKGMQTLSIVAAEKLNLAVLPTAWQVGPEAALRFPIALFGAFTPLLIFLVVRELFGRSIGLVSAALWAVEPVAISFDRVAKEDSLLLFFFLLTCFFWLRSQTIAERGEAGYMRYVWLTAAAFGAVMATKYNPWLLAIPMAYYTAYDRMSSLSRWTVGGRRWLIFFAVMGVVFVILNPTILIPQSWHEMLKFSSESRIGHDSYEFMGRLYPNKMSLWLNGVPWSFYYVFLVIKNSVPTLLLAAAGIPLLMRRRMGDGRFFIFFWAFLWFFPFTFLGGKFTRYFAIPEPVILILAAAAFCIGALWITNKLALGERSAALVQLFLLAVVLVVPIYNSLAVAPHYRMFTNTLGGGMKQAGTYFPHDEFYDAGSRDVVMSIAQMSLGRGLIACEAPYLLDYYADRIGMPALDTVSLSDPQAVARLNEGDFIVITSGRRYFSNDAYQQVLSRYAADSQVMMEGAVFARIYKLDAEKLNSIRAVPVP